MGWEGEAWLWERIYGAPQVALKAAEVCPSASFGVCSSDSERARVVLMVRLGLWVLELLLCL